MKPELRFFEICKQPNYVYWGLSLFLFFVCTAVSPNAAATLVDTLPGKKRISTIHYNNGAKLKGHISEVTDSSVTMIERKDLYVGLLNNNRIIPAEQIKLIERKERHGLSTVANMGLGLLAGALIGFSIGLSDCDDPYGDCNFFDKLSDTNNFRVAMILSGTLGSAGLVAGLFSGKKKKKKFTIGGRRSNLQQQKMDLLYY